MKTTPITMKQFIDFIGQMSVECLMRRDNGTSWLMEDGRVITEYKIDNEWVYTIIDPL